MLSFAVLVCLCAVCRLEIKLTRNTSCHEVIRSLVFMFCQRVVYRLDITPARNISCHEIRRSLFGVLVCLCAIYVLKLSQREILHAMKYFILSSSEGFCPGAVYRLEITAIKYVVLSFSCVRLSVCSTYLEIKPRRNTSCHEVFRSLFLNIAHVPVCAFIRGGARVRRQIMIYMAPAN